MTANERCSRDLPPLHLSIKFTLELCQDLLTNTDSILSNHYSDPYSLFLLFPLFTLRKWE